MDTGDAGLLSLYSFQGGGAVFQYAALVRCVEFVSATVAGLISDPESLTVLNDQGMEAKTRTAKTAHRLLTKSPDGGETAAHEFMEDFVADYCTSGNALARVIRSANFPVALERKDPWSSSAIQTRYGTAYTLHETDAPWGKQQQSPPVDSRQVVHCRWPRLRSSGPGGHRMKFAVAPIQVLRPALAIGMQGDRHVAEWFLSGGTGAQAAIIYKDSLENETQRREFDEYLHQKHSRTPLVLFDAPQVTALNQRPQSAETGSLREFQIREVCRLFGIPPAVLGELGGLRGIDIGAMTKAAWIFGIRHHTRRMLSALSLRLLPVGERFEVDRLGFIMEDPSTLSNLITATREGPNGTADVTRGEVRRWLGLPREPRDGEELPPPASREVIDPNGESVIPSPPQRRNGDEFD